MNIQPGVLVCQTHAKPTSFSEDDVFLVLETRQVTKYESTIWAAPEGEIIMTLLGPYGKITSGHLFYIDNWYRYEV